jgi:hypothetical protein
MRKNSNLLLSIFFCLVMLAACSTQTKTVKTETVYDPEAIQQPAAENAVVRKSESTETRTDVKQPQGLLSGAVDIVGKTIALPFKVVGGLIDVAF